jgi:hypothetical protein
MCVRPLNIVSAVGLAAALGGCNPAGYPTCFRVECPYPPVYRNSYAGYVPAYTDGRPAFGAPPFDDPFADYTQRSLTISTGAGNAQAANLALQTATPWPPHSSNTNIPANGARMVRAVQQFESGTRPAPAEPVGGGAAGLQINANTGGGAPGGGAMGGTGGAGAPGAGGY